jgi:uncharacterized protein (TIGR01777 family)
MNNAVSILISGGSGLIGRYLTSELLSSGFNVSHLSRKAEQFGKVRVHRWDPVKGILDPSNLTGVDYIIHLAGANIGEKSWSVQRKNEIISSRVASANLILRTIRENGIPLKAFISASAIGYYGSVTSERIFREEDPPGNDFLGKVCLKWENAADEFQNAGIRVVKVRTGVVLEKNDSALSKLMMPAKSGFLVQTGNGKQYMPWIHITDLCRIYLKVINDPGMSGAYNAVSPQSVTHAGFMKTLAKVMGKSVFPVPVPAIVLKAALGEMSKVVLEGSRVSSDKLMNSGFEFLYSDLTTALEDVLK